MARDTFKVELHGLERATRIPGWLEEGQREFMGKAVRRLRDEVAEKAPGGPQGRIGRSIDGRVISPTTGAIGSSHPGAKALDRGAYIVAKRGRALRFNIGGETVYRRFVRLPARRFFARGLRYRNRVVAEEFERVFDRVDDR